MLDKKKPITLKVGQMIYYTNPLREMGRTRVSRLTKTLAICSDGTRLKKDQRDSDWIKSYGGGDIWDNSTYKVETLELKAKYTDLFLRNKARNINWQVLDIDTVEKVLKITSIDN